jgi:hypothetical protein
LVSKLLGLLGLESVSGRYVNSTAENRPGQVEFLDDGTIVAGIDEVPMAGTVCGISSRNAFVQFMNDTFSGVELPRFIQGHHLWSQASEDYFAEKDIRMIVVLRDPRAVALSHINWIRGSNTTHPLRELYQNESMRSCLVHEFMGVDREGDAKYHFHLPMLYRYRNMAKWKRHRQALFLSFEQLVGRNGGGDDVIQQRAIEGLVRFLGLDDQIDIGAVANSLWGGTATFHTGMIDSWKEHAASFPPELSPQIEEILSIVFNCTESARVKAI